MTDAASEQEYPRLEPDDVQSTATGTAADPTDAEPTYGDEPSQWPRGKVDPQKRLVAIVIDAVIAVAIGMIPWIGGLISAAYWVLRDGLDLQFMDRRSVGKKLTKLRPVTMDGEQLDMMGSVRRNWMFGVGGVMQILVYIPILGWLLMIPVAILAFVIGIVELYRVIADPEGRRVGDLLADTKVIEVAE
jgi:uncharacterized RDD family membrane protein YckC